MEPIADDLLVQFADELQGWDAETAAGLAAVATLQRCFGELGSCQPSKETEDVYKRLLELAPSFRLEQYIQQQQKPPTTASDAAGSIHKAINTLRAAVATQQKLLSSLTDTCEQYQEAVLSQQLTGTSIATSADTADVTGAGTTTDTNSHQQVHEAAAAALAGEQSAADLLNVRIRGSDPAAAAAAAAAATAVKFEPEEVALLMGAVTAGLQQDLEWMAAAVDGINLETTPEQLNTLSTMWELQPFTNEAAAASIITAAAAAASAAVVASSAHG